jgi:molybdate transport system substrate-binding protein
VASVALAEKQVPAGEYGREALKRAGVLEAVEEKQRGGTDVQMTLKRVAQREADAGIVYATDAAASQAVRVAFVVPDDLHRPIRYPLVLLRKGKGRDEAVRFYEFLQSAGAADVFRRAGFTILP